MNWMDLHIHTHYSTDGEFTPEYLMFHCAAYNMKAVAITDHNTVRGVAEARRAAEAQELLFLSGIEIDCINEGQNYHVLGYGIDENSPAFSELEESILSQQRAASESMIDRVAALGIPFDHDWVRQNAPLGVVTGELIAESALEETNIPDVLRPYQYGGSRSNNPYVNFYWDFCAPGKPAYVPIHFPSLEMTVKLIHETGGAAVLAHPGANVGFCNDAVESAVSHSIDGIEVYSSYHDERMRSFYHEFAKSHGLLMTVGSDYHGKTKPNISIGGGICHGQGEMLYRLIERITKYR